MSTDKLPVYNPLGCDVEIYEIILRMNLVDTYTRSSRRQLWLLSGLAVENLIRTMDEWSGDDDIAALQKAFNPVWDKLSAEQRDHIYPLIRTHATPTDTMINPQVVLGYIGLKLNWSLKAITTLLETLSVVTARYWTRTENQSGGGNLHNALEDGNFRDGDLQWMLTHCALQGDAEAIGVIAAWQLIPELTRDPLIRFISHADFFDLVDGTLTFPWEIDEHEGLDLVNKDFKDRALTPEEVEQTMKHVASLNYLAHRVSS